MLIGILGKRVVALVLVLFFVVTFTFLLMRISPGGPFDSERKIPPAIEKELLAKYKLSGSLAQQYQNYLWDLLHGDLRISTKYRDRSVNEILAQALPITCSLGAAAFFVATFGGIWLGTIAATHHNSWKDRLSVFIALVAICMPTFITAPLLILVFGLNFHWLPVGGWGGPLYWILPTITLASPFIASIARLTRSSMLETLQQDFIRTAQAKGLSDRTIAYKHALRVAILPVISYLGPLAANLLTGSIVVESVFNIPGAGGFFVNSILNRDAFLLGGIVVVYCILLVIFNLIVDLIYPILDRRIRFFQ